MSTEAKKLDEARQHEKSLDFLNAATLYRDVLELQPNQSNAQYGLGMALVRTGKPGEALPHLQEAIRLDPQNSQAHHNLASALAELRRFDEAVAGYRAALKIDPEYTEAHLNLGIALKAVGKQADATDSFRRALQIAPDHIGALHNLGFTLSEMGRHGEAAVILKQLIRLKPDFPDAHNSLGLAQLGDWRFSEAEASFERALKLDPHFAQAHNNLGTCFKEQGRMEESLASYDLAVRFNPESASIHWNRSLALLQSGDFDRGWREYEWRWRREKSPPRRFRQPMWDGSDLKGRTILLHTEQGLGDTIQFVRYAALVKAAGAAKVLLECPSPLAKVLTCCPGVDELILQPDNQEEQPTFDVHLPLMSAPRLFATTLRNIPASIPYVAVEPDRIRFWDSKMTENEYRVGICWQGNPHHMLDRFRSVKLSALKPLAAINGIRLYSLQRGPGSEQLDEVSNRDMNVRELTSPAVTSPGDWADTAAIIAKLDLVITVDTAIAHLAGAIGVRTWLALASSPDWRWLLDRDDTPWYPSLRLFRQDRGNSGNWRPVFVRMAEEATMLWRPPRSQPSS